MSTSNFNYIRSDITVIELKAALKFDNRDVNRVDSDGNNALLYAIKHNCSDDVLLYLISIIAYINAVDNNKDNAFFLLLTHKRGNTSIFTAISGKKYNINQPNKNGELPLFVAINSACSDECIKFLIANINQGGFLNATGEHALFLAMEKKLHDEVIEYMIYKMDNVNITNSSGDTAIIYAIKNGVSMDTISYLIEKSEDVDVLDSNGNTALIYAIKNGMVKHVNMLLDNGADVNKSGTNGDTPLFCAINAETNGAQIINLLMEYYADVNFKNSANDTPLIYVAKLSKPEYISKLLENDSIDACVKDTDGNTALYYAIKQEFPGQNINELIEKIKGCPEKTTDTSLLYAIETDISLDTIHSLIDNSIGISATPKDGNDTVLIKLIKKLIENIDKYTESEYQKSLTLFDKVVAKLIADPKQITTNDKFTITQIIKEKGNSLKLTDKTKELLDKLNNILKTISLNPTSVLPKEEPLYYGQFQPVLNNEGVKLNPPSVVNIVPQRPKSATTKRTKPSWNSDTNIKPNPNTYRNLTVGGKSRNKKRVRKNATRRRNKRSLKSSHKRRK